MACWESRRTTLWQVLNWNAKDQEKQGDVPARSHHRIATVAYVSPLRNDCAHWSGCIILYTTIADIRTWPNGDCSLKIGLFVSPSVSEWWVSHHLETKKCSTTSPDTYANSVLRLISEKWNKYWVEINSFSAWYSSHIIIHHNEYVTQKTTPEVLNFTWISCDYIVAFRFVSYQLSPFFYSLLCVVMLSKSHDASTQIANSLS